MTHRNRLVRMPRLRWTLGIAVLAAGFLAPNPAQAQDEGAYPRINTATGYVVDPSWPQRPADMPWSDMPGVSVDRHNRVWLFTRSTAPIQVYDTDGKFIRSWGRDVIGKSHHIRIDHEGFVWIADVGHHVVRKFTEEGKLLLTLGTAGQAGNDRTHLDQPTDMAITRDGDVFVSDGYGNNRVVHFDRYGKFVKAWGKLGAGPGDFSLPHSIVVDSRGRLYVADRNNARIQVFDADGTFVAQWKNLIVPWGLWVTDDDAIWACGSTADQWREGQGNLGIPPKDQVFMKFRRNGKLLELWTVPKGDDGTEKPGECNWVHAIALDADGNIYAGDIRGKRAQKFVRKAGK